MAAALESIDLTLALSAADLPMMRAELERDGRTRFEPALDPMAAEALRRELGEAPDWVRTMRQGDTERELDAVTLAALSPVQLAAIEQLARRGEGGAFRFLRDVLRVSTDPEQRRARGRLVDRFVDGLNRAEVLALVSELAGTELRYFRGDATRFMPGHFLTTHNDRGKEEDERVLAMVVNLCHWQIDWGGLTLFHDERGDAHCAWTPRFNTLNLFRVPQDHSVSWVNALAEEPRLAISGWFYA